MSRILTLGVVVTAMALPAKAFETRVSPVEAIGLFAERARSHWEQAKTHQQIALQAARNAFALHTDDETALIDKLSGDDREAAETARKKWIESREQCEQVVSKLQEVQEYVEEARRYAERTANLSAELKAGLGSERKERRAMRQAEDSCKEADEARGEAEKIVASLREAWLIPEFVGDALSGEKQETKNNEPEPRTP